MDSAVTNGKYPPSAEYLLSLNARICASNSNISGYEVVCNGPHLVDSSAYILFLHSYITPLLITFTVATNVMVCTVLLKSTRTSTNTLLVAMAVSDTLTGLWPIPAYLYFYTAGHHQDWLPYSWCSAYLFLIDYLPTTFHTASIWLAMALAVQRYISICHPQTGKNVCTVSNVIKIIGFIYVLSLLSQISKFLEMDVHPVELDSLVDPSLKVMACYETLNPVIEAYPHVYYNTYYWFRVIFIHLIPCSSLVLLNTILILTMRAAQKRRHLLLRQNRRMESRRLEESTSTTMMLVTVVGLFLLVEVPLAVFLIAIIWDNTFKEKSTIGKKTVDDVSTIINFFILLSYPLNFFIYCGMSRQFRDTFRRLFVPHGPGPSDVTVTAAEPVDYKSPRRGIDGEENVQASITLLTNVNKTSVNGKDYTCAENSDMAEETNV